MNDTPPLGRIGERKEKVKDIPPLEGQEKERRRKVKDTPPLEGKEKERIRIEGTRDDILT